MKVGVLALVDCQHIGAPLINKHFHHAKASVYGGEREQSMFMAPVVGIEGADLLIIVEKIAYVYTIPHNCVVKGKVPLYVFFIHVSAKTNQQIRKLNGPRQTRSVQRGNLLAVALIYQI